MAYFWYPGDTLILSVTITALHSELFLIITY